MAKSLPPQLRQLMMARGPPIAAGPSNRSMNRTVTAVAAQQSGGTGGGLWRSRTEDGRRFNQMDGGLGADVRRPLLNNGQNDGNDSPRSL